MPEHRRFTSVESKSILVSKTVWFNVLSALLLFLASPAILGVLPAHWVVLVPALTNGINIVLRVFFTEGPVSFEMPKGE
jgi:hypothetical protein